MTAARWIAVALGLTGVFLLSVAAGGLIARQLKTTPSSAVAVASPTPFATIVPTLGATPPSTAASLPPSPQVIASPLPPPSPSPVPTLVPTPTAALDPATVEEFTNDLAAALRDRDTDYLNARLHAATVDRYGRGVCRTYIANLPRLVTWEILGVSGPAEWSYVTDEIETVITDAWTVSVSGRDPLHFAPLDGTWRWFTDCGDLRP